MKWSSLTYSLCLTSLVLFSQGSGQEKKDSTIRTEPSPAAKSADEELKRLVAAADAEPDDLAVQLQLAQGFFQRGMYKEALQKLRILYDKKPDNPGVLLGLESVVDAYKIQGLLNVGTLDKQVVALMGQPHHTVKMPWGIRYVYGVTAVDLREGKIWELVKLVGATEELFDSSHVIDVDLGSNPHWHVGIRQKGEGLVTAFLYPEGESIAKWNEMVTIERFVKQAEGKTMKEVLSIVKEQITGNESQSHMTVVEQNDSTAIFGVDHPARDGQKAKQQLVRLWMGQRDVHRLAYTHQGETPSNDVAEKWLAIMKAAKLKAYDPSVSKTSHAFSPRNQVKKMAEELRGDLRKASQYRPTEKAISVIAATDESKEKLQDYCDSVYKELSQAGAPAKPNQTEIIVFGPAEEELPGGYKSVRQHFKPEVKFYGFKYVTPGEKSGMSFDGAFEVEGKWYFLPKAHRAFR